MLNFLNIMIDRNLNSSFNTLIDHIAYSTNHHDYVATATVFLETLWAIGGIN